MAERPRVLIVGAGFGGLWCARRLGGEPVSVTLIDRNNFHTFYPLLYQIAAAELEAVEIAHPVRGILRRHRNVRFRMAELRELDLEGRRARTSAGEMAYDHLVLATGSAAHFFGVPGANAHAFPLRTLEDALALRNHILTRFERALGSRDPAERSRALRFVIVGGGPTGVEFAGAVAELLQGPMAKDFPDLTVHASVVLLEGRDRLLSEMPEELSDYAARRLRRMGVEVRLETLVDRIEAGTVHLDGGAVIPTETVTWTAGVQGDPDAKSWGLPTGPQGRVPVTPTLELPGRPEVQVIGDLAYLEQDGDAPAMVAPVAIQQGEHAAANILRGLRGRIPLPFSYRDMGVLAVVGRNAAVARVHGRSFTGWPAWLLWLGIHIVKLIGFRNRLVVLINWAWDYFFYERAVRLILPLGEATRRQALHSGPVEDDLIERAADPHGRRTEGGISAPETG